MIIILDKVIYGLGALTFVGVSLVIIGLVLTIMAGIVMGIIDSLKRDKKQPKSFGG